MEYTLAQKQRLKKKKLLRAKDYTENCLLAIPPLVGFLLFGLFPMIISVYISMTELHVADFTQATWVGLQNFKDLFGKYREMYWMSYVNMLIYALNVPVCIILGTYIAYLLNKVTKGKRILNTIFFIPYVCIISVVVVPFRMMYDDNNGMFNMVLNAFGFNSVAWRTASPWSFHFCLLLLTVWCGLAWVILLVQAALSQVDKTYYEAARIDGADEGTIFRKITLPAITPTLSYVLTMKLIAALQAMSEPYVLAGHNSSYGTGYWSNGTRARDTVGVTLYNWAFYEPWQYGFGLSAAGGWILAIIVLIVTRINMKLQEKWVCYDFA